MRKQSLIVLFCFVLAAVFVPAAEAQLSEKYAKWDEGPEGEDTGGEFFLLEFILLLIVGFFIDKNTITINYE